MTDRERFFSRVKKGRSKKACWIWTAGVISTGYGAFYVNRKQVLAHRFSYKLKYGRLPKSGLRHTCDTPRCVRPTHLLKGTQKQNIRDAISRGRMLIGELNGSAKLTRAKVSKIRRQYATRRFSQRALAGKNGVTVMAINHLLHFKTWK